MVKIMVCSEVTSSDDEGLFPEGSYSGGSKVISFTFTDMVTYIGRGGMNRGWLLLMVFYQSEGQFFYGDGGWIRPPLAISVHLNLLNLLSCIIVSMNTQMIKKQVVISALRGSGKTSLMMAFIRAIRRQGMDVKGVLSPGVFESDKKIAIETIDLATGESRILARLAEETTTDLQFGDWAFYQDVFDWINQRLSMVESTDILVVDEIGPLELDMKRGLQAAMDLLSSNKYRLGIITARPKCLEVLSEYFPLLQVYSLSFWQTDALIDEMLRIAEHFN